MIKKILKHLVQGNLTLTEIAVKLNLSRAELMNRLEIMEHMGYITKVCEARPRDENNCAYCTMSSDCSTQEDSKDKMISYKLTAKGRRVSSK